MDLQDLDARRIMQAMAYCLAATWGIDATTPGNTRERVQAQGGNANDERTALTQEWVYAAASYINRVQVSADVCRKADLDAWILRAQECLERARACALQVGGWRVGSLEHGAYSDIMSALARYDIMRAKA